MVGASIHRRRDIQIKEELFPKETAKVINIYLQDVAGEVGNYPRLF